ncbi:MAG: aldehyde dehydrogenase family protein [Thiohalomonadales bacterium]
MSHTFTVTSPVNDEIYYEGSYATETEITKALRNSVAAQGEWQKVPHSVRAEYCLRLVDALLQQQERCSEELSWQMGRPIQYGPNELSGFAERARYMIAVAESSLQDMAFDDQVGYKRFIRRVPVGVVLAMVPWNYPYLTAVNILIPALMAGNSVILKPSSQTPLTAERIANAVTTAGLPQDVFQYLLLDHEAANRVMVATEIDYVAFTGSTSAGRVVEKNIAGRFIEASLELGGKDPAYVRADAELEFSVANLVDGTYFNSGQSCCGIERIYVHKHIYKAFIDAFIAQVEQYRLGNPLHTDTTLGPMVDPQAVGVVKRQIDDATNKGGKTAIDATLFHPEDIGASYCAPQVVLDVDHSMMLMRQESFGPVVGIMSVDDDRKAIALMNDSEFALTASVWTQDSATAIELGEQVCCGTWFMNRCDYLDPALAWSGMKNSGKGCSLSQIAYEKLTRPRSFHLRVT